MELSLSHHLDPVAFTSTVLGLQPDPVQARILRAPDTRILLNCTRQWGKSTIVAALTVHHLCCAPAGSLVVIVSPSQRQSAEMLRKIAGFLRRAGLSPKPDGANRYSLLMLNQSRAVALPGKENTIRGFSAPSLVVVDEAALVPDAVYSAVRPMLAASATGRMILLSTPRGRRGFFYDEWTGGQPWLRISVPATDCQRISKQFLDEERNSLGDWSFRQEYLCEFMDTRSQLFSPELLSRALTNEFSHWSL
ncbi:MAG: hypothetical protein FJW39_01635 [Acidobacteria bacterium]|nr:hypothetical protein [Acidobacteriota bacterium]